MFSAAVTSRGYWNGSLCATQDTFHSNISTFSTLAVDVLLLALMFMGLLRWERTLGSSANSIFQLMYAQVLDLFLPSYHVFPN